MAARHWGRWQAALIFEPATVLAWQRRRFRGHWTRLSRREPGRPAVSQEPRTLIQDLSAANPRWGLPRNIGELRKLGIAVARSTIEKYRVRPRRPPSPSWRAVLNNHLSELVALDFFTVPTVSFKVLFVLIALAHDRRRILHSNMTEHSTVQWTAQQLFDGSAWTT
jgi:putative transposase